MDFRKTYSGPGSRFDGRSGSDPFSQLGRDTRQERDDRGRSESHGGGKGINRPTQSSLARGAGDNRAFRNSFSARTSGRYASMSHSIDLGPQLRGTSHSGSTHSGSSIPRQPATPQQHVHSMPPPPAAAAHAVREKLQDLVDAGQHREAVLHEQKRHLEASLQHSNMRCAELARGLQQASAALEAERAIIARLRSEHDEHVAELDRARSQAAELQASGSVAITTSEVCRAALSTAFKGTVNAIGSAHEELESALESHKQQGLELESCRKKIKDLEDAIRGREAELEDARLSRRKLSEEMEELAGRLQAREDELHALMALLAPPGKGSVASFDAAVLRARDLQDRVQQLEQQLHGQSIDVAYLQGRVADYQAQMMRVEERLRGCNSGRDSPSSAVGNIEAQVSELADEREQLEGDNLQLAAENEQLQRDNAGLRERLQEALLTAAAATERESAVAPEIARLNQMLAEMTNQADSWRQQAEASGRKAHEAQRQLEQSGRMLQDAVAQAEAARVMAEQAQRQAEEARVALEGVRPEAMQEKLDVARAEAQELSAEISQLRLKVAELQDQLAADRKAGNEAREQLNTMHANENALMQRILTGEVERQQLLKQIDSSNSAMTALRQKLDEAAQQLAETAELRARVASLTLEAEQQAKAAAVATARLASLEAELQELREALRLSAERANNDARLQERREQQLAVLRQQAVQAEEAQQQADKEINLLRAQVAVNDSLRARVDDLQARLHRATMPKPCADAFAQVSSGSGVSTGTCTDGLSSGYMSYAINDGQSHGTGMAHDGAMLVAQAHAVRQSMVAGWLGAGGAFPTGRDRAVADNLLESYNAIPEDEPADLYDSDDGRLLRKKRPAGRGPRVRLLRALVGLVFKSTLVAGGMALGLALGNPQAFQALRSGGENGGAAGKAPTGQVVVVEGIPLLSQG